ncbi:hypothetical protein NUU61_002106 [Penicillium alfredii]|uniref:Uncharacterized protein n=1 Tax=Penicillium alfredii TaxID=1506179 RepID=A0A9W9KFN6_9EURO|nr:uncharacterized protein NUU61_002106 [Penicillium alfredii]KAJ5104759.1 hypothetical protein NUU61_002106 [Penicillium alfredii]
MAEGVEVLEFIGFVSDAARLIYNRYLSRYCPEMNHEDIMSFFSAYIAQLQFAPYNRHIYSSIGRSIIEIPQEDVQMHISRADVMRLHSGKIASQWVFSQIDTIRRLAEEIRGKIHFTIVGASAPSPTAMAENTYLVPSSL